MCGKIDTYIRCRFVGLGGQCILAWVASRGMEGWRGGGGYCISTVGPLWSLGQTWYAAVAAAAAEVQGESASVPYYTGCTGEQGEACCTNVLWEEEPCFSLSAVLLWGFKKGAFVRLIWLGGVMAMIRTLRRAKKAGCFFFFLGGVFVCGRKQREKRSE